MSVIKTMSWWHIILNPESADFSYSEGGAINPSWMGFSSGECSAVKPSSILHTATLFAPPKEWEVFHKGRAKTFSATFEKCYDSF